MTWFKVDDSFHSHPKVLATDPAALGLWVVAGAWCSANLTDGFVPDYALPRLLPDSAELASKLVTAGLWKRAKGGHRFHDWRDFNPSAEEVQAEREAARNRMRDLRKKRRANYEDTAQAQDGSGEQQANVRAKFGKSSQPRPDPTRSSSYEQLTPRTTSSGTQKRGTRIPDDFKVTPAMVEWARENCPHIDGKYETEQFIGYWRAKTGANATKLDWQLTWQTWMRRAEKDTPRTTRPGNRLTGADSRNGEVDWSDPKMLEM